MKFFRFFAVVIILVGMIAAAEMPSQVQAVIIQDDPFAYLAAAPAGSVLLKTGFDSGSDGWVTVTNAPDVPFSNLGCMGGNYWIDQWPDFGCNIPLKWLPEGTVQSQAPWWVDPNHKEPGAGYLNLLAIQWLNGIAGGIPEEELDLSDTILRFSIQPQDLEIYGGSIYLWFQTYAPSINRYVNYALTETPIDLTLDDRQWSTITLSLRADDAAWTCLGSSLIRMETYGCIPASEAIHSVVSDFGLIVLPVDPDLPGTGTILLDNMAFYHPWVEMLPVEPVPEGQITWIAFALNEPLPATATLTVGFEDGSATWGVDYWAATNSLVFAPEQLTASLPVAILKNDQDEPREDFTIKMTGAQGMMTGDNPASLTLTIPGHYRLFLPVLTAGIISETIEEMKGPQ